MRPVETSNARLPEQLGFINEEALQKIGLSNESLRNAISGTYKLLDGIDRSLKADGVEPLCQTVELANLSSMIGNILAAEIAKHSDGKLRKNGPHKYPDLLGMIEGGDFQGVEIKMALGRNKPKGHLSKEGHYLTCRYVIIDADGDVTYADNREDGIQPVIWEIRAGFLTKDCFSESNTDGDSGKTAVVNKDGMTALKVVYIDLSVAPLRPTSPSYKEYQSLMRR